MLVGRIACAVVGIGVLLYGASQLVVKVPPENLLWVAIWMVALLVVHDGILAPAVVGLGWVIGTYVPRRGRRYLQAGLIVAAMITVVAVPLILRRGTQPAVKTLVTQDYPLHFLILLGGVAGVLLVAYLIRVARDRSAADPTG